MALEEETPGLLRRALSWPGNKIAAIPGSAADAARYARSAVGAATNTASEVGSNALRYGRSAAGALGNTAVGAAGQLARAGAPAAAGGAVAAGVNALRQNEMDNAAPFVPPPDAPGEIPRGPAGMYPSVPPVAGSTLSQTETGRNIGNAAMALGPAGVGALRAMQGTSQLMPFVSGIGGTAKAVGQGFIAGDLASSQPEARPAPVPPYSNEGRNSPAPLPPSAPAAASYSNEGKNYPTRASTAGSPVNGAPPNNILRTGNSYSGGPNIKFGADIVNPDGSVRTSGAPDGKGFGVTVLDTSAGAAADKAQLERNAAERAAAPAPGGVTGMVNSGYGLLDNNARRERSLQMETTSSKGGLENSTGYNARIAGAVRALSEMREQQDRMPAEQLRADSQRANTDNALRIAEGNNATSRANNENTNRTLLRGQQMDLQGKMIPAEMLAQRRAMTASLLKANGGDPGKAYGAAMSMGLTDIADDLGKNVTGAQGQAKSADDLAKSKWDEMRGGFKGQFNRLDKDGQPKVSEALEAKAFARFQRENPTMFQEGDPTKRQKAIQTAIATEELMNVFENPQGGGFANLRPRALGGAELPRAQTDMPPPEFFKGATLTGRYQPLRAAVTPGVETDEELMMLGGGRGQVKIPNLSANARALLQQQIDQANGKK